MKPEIIEENNIYAIGYSYEADWTDLCYTVDRAAYWSVTDFSNMDKAAYAGIENKRGMEIAFWLCKETGDFEMRFFFGERVEPVGNVPEGMEVLEIPAPQFVHGCKNMLSVEEGCFAGISFTGSFLCLAHFCLKLFGFVVDTGSQTAYLFKHCTFVTCIALTAGCFFQTDSLG